MKRISLCDNSLDLRVAPTTEGSRLAGHVNRLGAHLARNRRHDLPRITDAEHQLPVVGLGAGADARGIPGAAHHPCALPEGRIDDDEWQDGPLRRSGDQRRVVGTPQVATQPEHRAGHTIHDGGTV